MTPGKHCNDFGNGRVEFCEWYTTPLGQALLNMEAKFISRFVGISYRQLILQVGSLGWEDRFLDQDLFNNIIVLDRAMCCHENTQIIWANVTEIPVSSETIDFVILPHTLEFEKDQHQVLREITRVLKPEGRLLILGFNPWSFYHMRHFMPIVRNKMPWCGNFISRQRILDWLRLLNFEIETTARFHTRSSVISIDKFSKSHFSMTSFSYAVKAIKRRYTLIPLEPAKNSRRKLIAAQAVDTLTRGMANER